MIVSPEMNASSFTLIVAGECIMHSISNNKKLTKVKKYASVIRSKYFVQVIIKMFKIGDLAVYPAQGVGVIEAIECKEIMGRKQAFYVLRIMGNGMKIMVPMNSAKTVGLREVISKNEIPKIFDILKNRDVTIDKQTWNKRYRDYMEKIKSGSVYEIAKVLRDLLVLKNDKNLSFGERKMMDTAKNLLIKEISVATDLDEAEIEQKLKLIFSMQ